ncbi:MAG: HAD-IC family P-type ATPase, partial [Leptothrix sp. (in: b-proteobacteria)]
MTATPKPLVSPATADAPVSASTPDATPSDTAAPVTADAPTPAGLSAAEAARRLQADGANEPAPLAARTPWKLMAEVAGEPMFQLLAAAGGLYLLLGNLGDALVLLAFVAITVAITVVQGQRTEHALAALRELSRPAAEVIRDGRSLRIASREVVCGDLLQLREGDRIAADARLFSASDLQVDESLLSGESAPVVLTGASTERVHAGTLVVSGQGLAWVEATGTETELGRIGASLAEIASPVTPLTQQTRRLVRIYSVIGLALSALVVGLSGWQRGDWTGALLAGITLAMSMLPEELLLILTVFMAMGAWRLSRQQVLARRAATIEALGAATVLCTDKTGTLTRNQMTVAELLAVAVADANTPGAAPSFEHAERWPASDAAPPAGEAALSARLQTLLEHALLACELKPFDAMDLALRALADARLDAAHHHPGWALVHEYPLAPERAAMTHVWRPSATGSATESATGPAAGHHVVAVKGAWEAVARLCRLDA